MHVRNLIIHDSTHNIRTILLNSRIDYKTETFRCPQCGTYTNQEWYNLAKGIVSETGLNYYEGFIEGLKASFCSICGKYALWLNNKIIHPITSIAPLPTEYMPLTIKDSFQEARSILSASPKAACTLLRMGIQRLMIYLGQSGQNIELDISNLIRKGLPVTFLDALWAVRVTGPEAVNPNEIDPKDDVDTAIALFNLTNMLVESTISQQRKVNRLYTTMPKPQPTPKQPKRKRKTRKTKKPRTKKREIIPKPTLLYR